MTSYKLGDIVLANFRFTDDTGSKSRPALVVSSEKYQKSRGDVIVVAITSNTSRAFFGDTPLNGWEKAGLLYPSFVSGVVRTVHQDLIIRKLGEVSQEDFRRVKTDLKRMFDL